MGDSFESFEQGTADAWNTDIKANISSTISRIAADSVINSYEPRKSVLVNAKVSTKIEQNALFKVPIPSIGDGRPIKYLPGSCVRVKTDDNRCLDKISTNEPELMEKFRIILLSPHIDLQALRELSWKGIPFCYRPKVWKLLMNYLPCNSDSRDKILAEKRNQYSKYVEQYYEISANLKKPNETINQIRKDTKRTSLVYGQETLKNILERILYICAWRTPACSYVQGMNDLVMPFLAVFINEYARADINSDGHLVMDSTVKLTNEQLFHLEADIYWCFSRLIHSIQHNYIPDQPGIHTNVKLLKLLVSRVDEPLHKWLEENQVAYLQFSFRWMNNLLIRELPLRCCIRLWDAYMSETDGFDKFHVYVCAAFLLYFSEKVKEERDFQGLLLLLQRLPTSQWSAKEIEFILARAYSLKMTFAQAPGHIDTNGVEILF